MAPATAGRATGRGEPATGGRDTRTTKTKTTTRWPAALERMGCLRMETGRTMTTTSWERTQGVRVRIALAVARCQVGVGWWVLMVSTTATTTRPPLPSLASCLAMA